MNTFQRISLTEETTHRPGPFGPLVARICQAAKSSLRNTDDGLTVVTIKVLMNQDGHPVMWTEPTCTRLEPATKAAAFFEVMGW